MPQGYSRLHDPGVTNAQSSIVPNGPLYHERFAETSGIERIEEAERNDTVPGSYRFIRRHPGAATGGIEGTRCAATNETLDTTNAECGVDGDVDTTRDALQCNRTHRFLHKRMPAIRNTFSKQEKHCTL